LESLNRNQWKHSTGIFVERFTGISGKFDRNVQLFMNLHTNSGLTSQNLNIFTLWEKGHYPQDLSFRLAFTNSQTNSAPMHR